MLEEFDKVYIKIPEKNIFFEAYYFLEYKNNKNYYLIICNNNSNNIICNDSGHISKISIKSVNKKYVSKIYQKEIIFETKKSFKYNKLLFLNGQKIEIKKLDLLKSIYAEPMQDIVFCYYMIKGPNLYEKSKYFLEKKMKKILHFIKIFR